jgi:GTPase
MHGGESLAEETFKAGYVAVIGRPNVGKSTLMNAFLGQKVAAVSPRPQTTRRRQLGILTLPQAQIIFIDTPGIHKPVDKMGNYMNEVALSTLQDADLLLWLVSADEAPSDEDRLVASRLNQLKSLPPVILALNKTDLLTAKQLAQRRNQFQELLPKAELMAISATAKLHLNELQAAIITHLPEGQPFFDAEQVTDLYEREIAVELIREAVLMTLRDEVPHSVAVRLDEYKDRDEETAYIAATLLVERDSQKGIVIGHGGEMLKQIGTQARKEIEALTERKVFLELRVKVSKNWRNDINALQALGYSFRQEN